MQVDFFKKRLGREGEELAADFLQKSGHEILARNYRSRYGEIDIITEKDEAIYFVEVKSRHSFSDVMPEELIPYPKQRRISQLAQHYFAKKRITDQPGSFAMVVVDFGGEVPAFEFIPDIFELNWGY